MKSTKSSQATSASCYPIPASITTNLIHSVDFEIGLLGSDQNVRLCADENLESRKGDRRLPIHAVNPVALE
jgi:hypothetical protein